MIEVPSASRANKAGDRLRRMYREPLIDEDAHDREMAILSAWRAQFKAPMGKTTMSLRSAVETALNCSPTGRVFERFKREDAILLKLIRHSTRLSMMEDIAGCRAILESVDDVYRVCDRLVDHSRSLTFKDPDDYIANPRNGGYRALHLHAMRGDIAVEIQLRTRRQHEWSQAVESWDSAFGHDIKHENGPPEIVEAFRLLAEIRSHEDHDTEDRIWSNLMREKTVEILTKWLRANGGTRDDDD